VGENSGTAWVSQLAAISRWILLRVFQSGETRHLRKAKYIAGATALQALRVENCATAILLGLDEIQQQHARGAWFERDGAELDFLDLAS